MTVKLMHMARPRGWLDRLLHPNHVEMPWHFKDLAEYNAEVSRGIVHTAACDAWMASLQREFEEWMVENRAV